jgi:hypothetical protein
MGHRIETSARPLLPLAAFERRLAWSIRSFLAVAAVGCFAGCVDSADEKRSAVSLSGTAVGEILGYVEGVIGAVTRAAGSPIVAERSFASVGPAATDARPKPAVARDDAGTPSRPPEREALRGPEETLQAVRKRLAALKILGAVEEVKDGALDGPATEAGGAYFVQIGSHQLVTTAEDQLNAAAVRYAPLISAYGARVKPVQLLPQGLFYRVQIGPLSSRDAFDLCRSLKARKQACFTLAEKPAEHMKRASAVRLVDQWASIVPDRGASGASRKPAAIAAEAGRPRQTADALPLYTAPGMPDSFE